MKKYILSILIIIFFLTECWEVKVTEAEIYGNDFIHLNQEKFNAPETWIAHNLFDSAFQIKLPVYMHQEQTNSIGDGMSSVIFIYKDTVEGSEYHYGRVGIDYYYHPNGDFPKSYDYISHYSQIILAPLVTTALSGGDFFDYKIPEGKIINGPFYESHLLHYDTNFIYAYDAFYRRKGHMKGRGAVSCHIFVMMNKTEAAAFYVSFHDQDSTIFSNLFNVMKTFKWNHVND